MQADYDNFISSLINNDKPKKLAESLLHDATKLVKLVSIFPTAKLAVGKKVPNDSNDRRATGFQHFA